MLTNPADWLSLADRPIAVWPGGLSSMPLITLSEYLIYVADRWSYVRLRESSMRLIDRWASMSLCVINLGTDQPMVIYEVTHGSSIGPIDRWFSEVACDSSGGPIDR